MNIPSNNKQTQFRPAPYRLHKIGCGVTMKTLYRKVRKA